MKKILFLLSFCCSTISYGQTSTYSFSHSVVPGGYVSIAGGPGTIAATISGDELTQTSIPIGFTFPYCSTPYTTLSAADNGWLSLANSSTNNYNSFSNHLYAATPTSSLSAIGGGIGLLMPFWDDLRGASTTPPVTATAYYQTSGTAPLRVFTFQWGTPASPWLSYLSFGEATFQVKLYETSGVIEYIYGSSTYYAKTGTIGICNSTSDYRTLFNENSTVPSSTFYYSVDSTPALNSVLQWAPPCPSPPAASTGTDIVCQGATTNLSNPTPGGTWVSSSVSVATVGSGTGVVTGVAGGVVNISYVVSPGCFAIRVVTVNPLPDTIGGGTAACEGLTKTYTNITPGGTWSSSNTAVGTISVTGLFGGVTAGTTTLSYTLASGCARTLDVTVNSQPIITGSNIACLVDTTVLTSLITGGTWSSSNTARATVDAFGNVVGVTLGTVIITYTAPSTCRDTMFMTVVTICPTAVNDVPESGNKINVYPHPTKGDFYMSIPVTGSATVIITDICGKTILTRAFEGIKSEKMHFNEDNSLPPGSYILKLMAGEQTYIGKLTIIR